MGWYRQTPEDCILSESAILHTLTDCTSYAMPQPSGALGEWISRSGRQKRAWRCPDWSHWTREVGEESATSLALATIALHLTNQRYACLF